MNTQLYPKALWPLNVWSTDPHDLWAMDNVALSHSSAFSCQLTGCGSIHWFFVINAHLPHFAVCSSFSFPRFSWPTISNFHNVHYVHQVWTQSDVVGCMDECNMMVGIHSDSRCALTAPSLTGTPSLTHILLVNFVSNSNWAISLICKRQDDIGLINRQSTPFGV